MRSPFGYGEEFAIMRGGLHGRPSGNVAGIVYGGARTRQGKVVTARELVFPSNPQTAAQVLQRLKFSQALFAVRHLTASWWQGYFNRSIGQLPGFQSMMSIVLENTDAAEELGVPPDTPLGNLHFPITLTVDPAAVAAGHVQLDWTAELGLNGTVDDRLRVCAIDVSPDNVDERPAKASMGITDRADMTLDFNAGAAATDMIFGVFFEGYGTAEGILSPVQWYAATSHA